MIRPSRAADHAARPGACRARYPGGVAFCAPRSVMEAIRSAANPLIRRVRAVGAGRAQGVLLLEGERLVEEALRQGLRAELILIASDKAELSGRADELQRAGQPVRLASAELLARCGTLSSPPGILALFPAPAPIDLAGLLARGCELVVVAAGIQDPGNLGALARTAEAAGAEALVVAAGGCSPWNPKALRGSMGSLLRLPVVAVEEARAAQRGLAAAGFRQLLAATRGGADAERLDWSGRVALWLTGESGRLELDPAARGELQPVSLALEGDVESLNVTAAAAVLLFAARRSRRTAR